MLTHKRLGELKEHLERAQNPVFLYDNDADGFCSFVLLRRFLGRGKGVAIRTRPDVDVGYARRAHELGADYVFVLDRPFLGDAFVTALKELNIPLVWIDHHRVDSPHYNDPAVHVFNPAILTGKAKSSEPVTWIAYTLSAREDDVWIALMGCISDHYLPPVPGFKKKYADLWSSTVREPFDAYYGTELGRLARSIGFGLKDSITHVVYLQNFMITCQTPYEMIHELESSSSFAEKYREVQGVYRALLERARLEADGRIVFFRYGGGMSISSDLANELSYLYQGKFIVVAYAQSSVSNLSIRGTNVRAIIERLLPNFTGASGGGHADAVGVRLRTEDLERFKEAFEKEID